MAGRRRTHGWARSANCWIALGALLAGLAVAPIAVAADAPIKLAVEPVDEGGAWFERSLAAGASADLTVDLANYGAAEVQARTYAADVYSIINGGFGVRLRGEPSSGTTAWLVYPTEVLEIGAGEAVRRSFTVTVPPDTEPGEYITSIVIENEEPLSSGEGVAFEQFVRSAVAVVVTVPGAADATLELGDARHSFLESRSVVGVGVENVGDLLLRPAGTLRITTEAGEPVEDRQVAMHSVYSHTATWLEVVLDHGIAPGRYLAIVDLADAERGGAVAGERPFVVGEPETVVPAPPGTQPTDTIELPVVGRLETGGVAPVTWVAVIVAAALAIVLLAFAWRRRRDAGSGP